MGRRPLAFGSSLRVAERRSRDRFFALLVAALDLVLTPAAAFLTERLAGFFRVFLAIVLVKDDIRNVRFHE